MMKRIRDAAAAVLLGVFAVLPASASDLITGIYSDMRIVEGDFVGMEVFILASHDEDVRYHALVQFGEGPVAPPILVPVEADGDRIAFTVNYLGIMDVEAVRRSVPPAHFSAPVRV